MAVIHATTAQFPGFSVQMALKEIDKGVSEPFWGVLSTQNIQICPQTHGHLSPDLCEKLMEDYPHIQFRLHANARVWPRHVMWDASSYGEETKEYFNSLFSIQKLFKSSWMSIHAGFRKNCSSSSLWDNINRIRELADSCNTSVCIEGLYPSSRQPQFVDTWEGYEELLKKDIPFALDLSHLKIVERHCGPSADLKKELLSSSLCKEIHVSENNGLVDRHDKITQKPRWLDSVSDANPSALWFSEGRLV